jgi:tetratricopeptide (TPR) repeat protein
MDSATKYAALALIYSPVDNLSFLRSFASCHVNRFIQQSDTKDREIALVYLARALRQSPKLEKEIVEAYTALLMNGQDHRRCIQSLLAMASLFESAPANIQAMRVASLAICYRDAHEGELAVEYFEKAIELAPNESSYHYELGGMFKRSEFSTLLDVNRALQHVQRALELAPNSAVVTYSLASIYAIARQLDQAIELYERAYRLDSTLEVALVEAYQLKQTVCNWKDRDVLARRIISLTKKQLAKAVPVATSGLSAPHLTPWYGLSMRLPRGMQLALARRHAHVEAMRAVEFVSVALAAAQAEAKVNKEMFDRQERDEVSSQSDTPSSPTAQAPAATPRSSIVASKGRSSSATSASAGGALSASGGNSSAAAAAAADDDSGGDGVADDDYDDVFDDDNGAAPPPASEPSAFADDEAVWTPAMLDVVLGSAAWRNEPLRVGVLSSDFSDSNVGQSLIGWLRDPGLDDGGRVKLFIYSLVDSDGSLFRRSLCGADDRGCINVGALPTNKLNDRIRADRVDVLINMNGFTKFSRNELMPLRPAPVRVNYKGYPGTMGAYHDYIIGDPILTPLEHRDLYSERIVQLPHSFFLTSYPENYGHALYDLERPSTFEAGARPAARRPDGRDVCVLQLQPPVQTDARRVRRLDATAGGAAQQRDLVRAAARRGREELEARGEEARHRSGAHRDGADLSAGDAFGDQEQVRPVSRHADLQCARHRDRRAVGRRAAAHGDWRHDAVARRRVAPAQSGRARADCDVAARLRGDGAGAGERAPARAQRVARQAGASSRRARRAACAKWWCCRRSCPSCATGFSERARRRICFVRAAGGPT